MTVPRLDDIRARLKAAFRGPWGVMHDGPKGDGEPWVAHMEAAPGLTVGAVEHTEPVARVSGYLYDVKANAALISHAPEDIAFLLALVEKQDAEAAVKACVAALTDDDLNALADVFCGAYSNAVFGSHKSEGRRSALSIKLLRKLASGAALVEGREPQ